MEVFHGLDQQQIGFRKTWWMYLIFPFCKTTYSVEGDYGVKAKWWRGTCYILRAGKVRDA